MTKTERAQRYTIVRIEQKGKAERLRRAARRYRRYKPKPVVWPAWIRAML